MISPCFQFYPKDWLSSQRVTLMTIGQEGALIRLLAIAWTQPDYCITSDEEQLAKMCKLTYDEWCKGGYSVVLTCFRPHAEKVAFLVNDRLLAEVEKQRQWRKKSAEGGKNSALKRWGSDTKIKDKGGYPMVTPAPLPNGVTFQFADPSLHSTPIVPKGDDGFDQFWTLYPRKVKKLDALRAWEKGKCSAILHKILTAVQRHCTSEEWRKDGGKYIPHPTSWLNKQRWDDELKVEDRKLW